MRLPEGYEGLDAPGTRVWVSRAANPARALPLTLELVEADGGFAADLEPFGFSEHIKEGDLGVIAAGNVVVPSHRHDLVGRGETRVVAVEPAQRVVRAEEVVVGWRAAPAASRLGST